MCIILVWGQRQGYVAKAKVRTLTPLHLITGRVLETVDDLSQSGISLKGKRALCVCVCVCGMEMTSTAGVCGGY